MRYEKLVKSDILCSSSTRKYGLSLLFKKASPCKFEVVLSSNQSDVYWEWSFCSAFRAFRMYNRLYKKFIKEEK